MVLALLFLAALVGALFVELQAPDERPRPRGVRASFDLNIIANKLMDFQRATGGFPVERLLELVTFSAPPTPASVAFVPLRRLPLDPWRRPYKYRPQPELNAFTIWTLGRDGQPGGSGEDADLCVKGTAQQPAHTERCDLGSPS
jgi:hypothetical protein